MPDSTALLAGNHERCPTCGAAAALKEHQRNVHSSTYCVQCSNGQCVAPHQTPWCTTPHAAVCAWDTRINSPETDWATQQYRRQCAQLITALEQIRDVEPELTGAETLCTVRSIVRDVLDRVPVWIKRACGR
jgi:hypothetical protein